MTASRLSLLLRQPGGMTVAEASAAAHARLSNMQPEAVASIDGMIARMAALGPSLARGPDRAALDELYVLANAVFGTAGLFGLHEVGEVAYSLCDLIDRLRASGTWHPLAVQVHLNGLALARGTGGMSPAP
jgi:chemotaxis protein histidine kinase CheA